MKKLAACFLLALAPACGDSHASLADESVGLTTEMVEILEGIDDRDDVERARSRLEALAREAHSLRERGEALDPLPPEEQRALAAKLEKRMASLQPRMTKAVQRLAERPEVLAELGEVMAAADLGELMR